MATKKQKHAQALAKRQALEEELRQSGLRAQKADRERREAEERKLWQEQHDKKHYKFIDECPICTDIKKDLRSEKSKAAIAKMPKPRQRRSATPELEEIPDNSSVEMECV